MIWLKLVWLMNAVALPFALFITNSLLFMGVAQDFSLRGIQFPKPTRNLDIKIFSAKF